MYYVKLELGATRAKDKRENEWSVTVREGSDSDKGDGQDWGKRWKEKGVVAMR